jgi:2-oxoisovalerate dehydrogenase E2 component (dihydrolipoyl transacylase)
MPTTTRITMPQLGESVHEGTISKWLVKPGDKLVEFEPMLEVETDKVATEMPSPVTGTLKEILAPDGSTVPSGAEIAVVELEDGAPAPKPEAAAPQPAGETGPMPSAGVVPERAEPAPAPAREAPAERAEPREAEEPEAAERLPSGEHRFSPAVRMLAEQNGIDLDAIRGTGIGGRVTKKDVEAAMAARSERPSAAPAGTPAGAQAPAAAPAPAAMEGDEKVPLTRIKRLVGENMVRSKTTIPHAWQTQETDMSGVVANRNANKGKFQKEEGFSLTYLPYVVMAAVVGLREHRDVNATFGGDHILVHRDINIGISVGIEDALVVPVIKRADSLSIAGLARAINDLAARARDGKLRGDDLQGGTFTVNNSGTFGTLFSYSVIAPGQAGILTMEAIVERPVAVQGMLAIKPMMYLCFSFDHRVLDGLQAARFLVSCRKWLESVTAETEIY